MSNDPINIQVDPEALRQQVQAAIDEAMEDAATRLRLAADALDRGKFWERQDEAMGAEYRLGYENGEAAAARERAT